MNSTESSFNNNMWSLKKKVMPQLSQVATAKKDEDGRLVTNSDKLKKLILDHFVDRLK